MPTLEAREILNDLLVKYATDGEQPHAHQLVKTCSDFFNQGDDFVKKITGNANVNRQRFSLSASTGERVRVRCRSGIRPSCRIREFRNRPNPKVVVTVDTPSPAGAGEGGRRPGEGRGAKDIPALEFIVFLRPVKSRILWEQMLGRGTRLCPDINKSRFVVSDCFDGTRIQYFKQITDFKIQSDH